MAEPSAVYQGNTPSLESGGLNALQLALANFMAIGNPPPFAVNDAFMQTMKTFSDSGVLSPFTLDPVTGLPRIPDLNYSISDGIAYVARGDDMYLLRRAQDCGPDENRLEEIYLGRRPDVAEGTWAFYGQVVGGTVSSGANDGSWGGEATVTNVVSLGYVDVNVADFSLGFNPYSDSSTSGGSTGSFGATSVNGGTDPNDPKYVCTAMCRTYGFGEFRTKIWLAWSRKHLNDYHQIGYHTLFLPMVNYAYYSGTDSVGKKAVRATLEFLMRHRTADLRARLRGNSVKRDTIGRIWNAIFEPLIYITGKIKGRK